MNKKIAGTMIQLHLRNEKTEMFLFYHKTLRKEGEE